MSSSAVASKRALFLGLLLCAAILLLIPHALTAKLQFAFRRCFRMPLGLGRSITLSARAPANSAGLNASEYQQLRAENLRMQNHIANLKAQLEQQQEELKHLAQLRLTPDYQAFGLVPAQTITAVGHDQLLINRGSADYLVPGQFVLADNAIVGRIQQCTTGQATVMMISHTRSRMQVTVGSPSVKGILTGLGEGRLEVQHVTKQHNLSVGMPVHVCTVPGFLKIPIIVGRVSACTPSTDNPLLWDISVDPAADLKHVGRTDVIVESHP